MIKREILELLGIFLGTIFVLPLVLIGFFYVNVQYYRFLNWMLFK
jgi:hypothetical protein